LVVVEEAVAVFKLLQVVLVVLVVEEMDLEIH
jgi:hypothetical protein